MSYDTSNPLKAKNLMTMESKYGYVQENNNILIMRHLNQVSKENLRGVKAICHDDAIFYGNFELKILYFHKIEISEKKELIEENKT